MGSALKDILENKKSDNQKDSKAHFKNMNDIISGERAFKIQAEGEKKTGKSRFCLSVLNYLYFERGLNPEEILVVWIDLDNGLVPLVEQELIPVELVKCIEYHLCTDFGEVLEKTDEGIEMLEKHIKKYGSAGAWLMIDNMGKAWEGARDYYSRAVYGKPMKDLLIEAKQRALDRSAATKGKKHGRIPAQEFDQLTDYGIINPLHNDWADKIKDSNINFIWTALLKYEEKEVRGNQKTVVARGEGQKHNAARVDFIIRKKLDEGRYLTNLIGSRYTSNLFGNEEDFEFGDFIKIINKTMEVEKKKRSRQWEEKRVERAKTIEEKRKDLNKTPLKTEKPPTVSEVLEENTKKEGVHEDIKVEVKKSEESFQLDETESSVPTGESHVPEKNSEESTKEVPKEVPVKLPEEKSKKTSKKEENEAWKF